jgi:hypothetical protein
MNSRALNVDSCTANKMSLSPRNRMDKSLSADLSPKKNTSSPKNTPLSSPKTNSKSFLNVLDKKNANTTSYRYKSQVNSANKLRIV